MDATIVWLIVALFYAPLHFLLPILVALMTGREESEARKRRLVATAIDCTLSMVVAFAVVIWLAAERLQVAMFVLLLSMALPYLRIWLHHRAVAA
jgi:ABC-type sugar transport system permease subunit